MTSFLMYHARQSVISNMERSISGSVSNTCSSHSVPELCMDVIHGKVHTSAIVSHKIREKVHRHNEWKQSSVSVAHNGHKSVVSRPRTSLFLHVGKESVATLQAKFRTVGGTFVDQLSYQHERAPFGRELDPVVALLWASSKPN